MEERCSVNSPRRILSFSKNRRTNVPSPDSKGRSRFSVSGEHGPKLLEVYGFVGSITIVVATVVFITWAYFPDSWLHSLGIYYYPSRYWALAVPTYVMVTIFLGIVFYIGLNFMATPAPTSFNTIFDEFSREPQTEIPYTNNDEMPIEPISDISIAQVNECMFNCLK